MIDETEQMRREMIERGQPAADLAVTSGPRWSTDQLREEFEVIGFQAPFVTVRRRTDGVKGCLEFTHSPRVYFNWKEDKK